jgi:FKBP-type peptidyl-prolyl cis-trans isomerase
MIRARKKFLPPFPEIEQHNLVRRFVQAGMEASKTSGPSPTRAFSTQQRKTKISIKLSCAALALAIIAAVSPVGRSAAAANQVIEMPNGLKYTDSETGSGAEATAGHKVSVHYTGWLSNNGAKGKKFDSSVDRGQPFQFTPGRIRLSPAGMRASPA